MLFHTWTFVLFFLLVYGVYLAVKNTPLREPWLLVGSYVFYGWWNPLYLLLILYSTTVDYLAVVGMGRTGRWPRGLPSSCPRTRASTLPSGARPLGPVAWVPSPPSDECVV